MRHDAISHTFEPPLHVDSGGTFSIKFTMRSSVPRDAARSSQRHPRRLHRRREQPLRHRLHASLTGTTAYPTRVVRTPLRRPHATAVGPTSTEFRPDIDRVGPTSTRRRPDVDERDGAAYRPDPDRVGDPSPGPTSSCRRRWQLSQ